MVILVKNSSDVQRRIGWLCKEAGDNTAHGDVAAFVIGLKKSTDSKKGLKDDDNI